MPAPSLYNVAIIVPVGLPSTEPGMKTFVLYVIAETGMPVAVDQSCKRFSIASSLKSTPSSLSKSS